MKARSRRFPGAGRTAAHRAVAALLLGVSACAPATDAPDAPLAIELRSPERVEFGVAFPLEVVRVWPTGYTPESWDVRPLEPLRVRRVGAGTHERNGRVVETLRYEAYAFAREAVAIDDLGFSARAPDGSTHRAEGAALRLAVAGALPPEPEPAPELPGPPYPAPRRWGLWIAGALLASALLGLVTIGWRRRPGADARLPTEEPEDPHALALREIRLRFAELRERPVEDERAVDRFYVDASSAVRAFLEGWHGLHAPERTTEEFFLSPATSEALPAEQRDDLQRFLVECDLVKFAAQRPGPEDRARLLARAEAFVANSEAARVAAAEERR